MSRLLTNEQQAQFSAELELREQLTDKALARRYGLSWKQVRNLVLRLRSDQRRQNAYHGEAQPAA